MGLFFSTPKKVKLGFALVEHWGLHKISAKQRVPRGQ